MPAAYGLETVSSGRDTTVPTSILLIDDDRGPAHLICEFLRENGFPTRVETNGEQAAGRILREQPSLVIVDVRHAGVDGLSLCRNVRPVYPGPILMLDGVGSDIDEVKGLETGADDYIAKPVRLRVLLAHVRALLRRWWPEHSHSAPILLAAGNGATSAAGEPEVLDVGSLRVNERSREVTLAGRPVQLTSAEFDVLWLLATHRGTTVSRSAICQRLRGIEYDGLDRSVDLKISKIRKKLGDDPKQPLMIKSIRGVGYRLT